MQPARITITHGCLGEFLSCTAIVWDRSLATHLARGYDEIDEPGFIIHDHTGKFWVYVTEVCPYSGAIEFYTTEQALTQEMLCNILDNKAEAIRCIGAAVLNQV